MAYTHYVTMSSKYHLDTLIDHRIEKIVICCENVNQAMTAHKWALSRNDMRSVNITTTKPYYSSKRYKVQYWDYVAHEPSILTFLEYHLNDY